MMRGGSRESGRDEIRLGVQHMHEGTVFISACEQTQRSGSEDCRGICMIAQN